MKDKTKEDTISEKQIKKIARIIYTQKLIPGIHTDESAIDKYKLAQRLSNYFYRQDINFNRYEFIHQCAYGH